MNYAESVVDLVGNTPLVKLGTVAREAGVRATVLAKVEYFNPGGSVKDRIGVAMIVIGALFYWPLDVPAGAVSVTLGAVLLLWQALGRTVFAGPAGARPAVVTS